ncbi:MAG: hypothetical protein E2O39_05010 [Planctomycetota bacterium]|nr:MAG: hypothetical protein E2O39_05010 [Planctomycetota bacterium]
MDALVVHDDGSGPALYAGGSFTSSGGVPVNRVARWNGTSWSAVGSSSAGVSGRTLAVFDDGTGPALFAGGGSLWKWDGTMWTSVATVVGSQFAAGLGGIEDLEVFDDGSGPALYAGGAFTATGTAVAHNVARWNGASWSPLGLGIGGVGIAGINPANVIDLHTFDTGMGPRLYAGGWFTEAGGAPASGVAAWDGGTWSNLDGGIGPGPINGVFGLGTHDDGTGPGLYAGGQFFEMGGTPAGNLAVRASFPAASIHCAAESYCTATPNSTGAPAAIFASGSASVAANDLVLGAGPVPNQPGIFFYGAQQASTSFGNGTPCIAGRVGRLDVVNAVGNVMTVVLDNTSPPSAATQITPGSTWNFQAWFRDPMPGGASFDLSNGLNLVFSP